MEYFTPEIIVTGFAVFFARIADVSLAALRTICIIRGRVWMTFWIGLIEISIWLIVISTVVLQIKEMPILGIFFAFGFALGNVVGMLIEGWLAFGDILLRVISRKNPQLMTQTLRQAGFGVTTFRGEGMSGAIMELCIICRRKNLKKLLDLVREIEPDAFYITEQVEHSSKPYQSIIPSSGSWRNFLGKK